MRHFAQEAASRRRSSSTLLATCPSQSSFLPSSGTQLGPVPGSSGNGTNSGCRGASPEGGYWVEYRCGAIMHGVGPHGLVAQVFDEILTHVRFIDTEDH